MVQCLFERQTGFLDAYEVPQLGTMNKMGRVHYKALTRSTGSKQ